jgi:hypothetical protein
VTGAGTGSPNRLLSMPFGGAAQPDTVLPQTSITAPANASTVSGTVTVTATATDASGVSRVKFWIHGALKGSDTTAPYTYAWDTTAAANASHSLVSKAVDTWNNMGTSAAASVNVSNVVGPADLVGNGSFETGATPWSFAGHASLTSGAYTHSGSAYALLGNRNRSNDTVSQSVTIPAGATAALTFLAERHLERLERLRDRHHLC